MFTKPIYITVLISFVSGILTCLLLILLTDLSFFKSMLVALVSSFGLIVVTQLILEKHIYGRMKLLFDKVLNLSLDQRLKLSEDPFEAMNERVDTFLKNQEEVEELKNQQQFRREYIGNIAHELKTPVFTIQGYISTLLDGGLEDKRINRDYLERADKSTDRLITLLEDLDLITKFDAGKFPLDEETFDIIRLTEEVIDSIELKAKKRNISVIFETVPGKQVFVDADKNKIFQVILNLIVNSIKYGNENGITRIEIDAITDDHVLIEVIDNGIGISDQNKMRIFERFYRVDKSRGRKLGGSGLGLSIVKHIVEAHGQSLNVASEYGKGSTFSFTLKSA